MKDELDRRKYPRMPWHDVHCALWGPPCRDAARHFVQRWNYAKVIDNPLYFIRNYMIYFYFLKLLLWVSDPSEKQGSI